MKTPSRFVRGLILALLAVPFTRAAETAASGQAPIKPYDAAQQQRMQWFTEARLGLFIHWGLYSIPAGQWPGRESTRRGEWIMQEEKIPSAEYEKLASQFNPVKFDAKAWVAVAQAAGFKYLVVTTKHHEGFCLFPSKLTTYDIADATPFKRDPIKELAAACHEAGIVFCVYYSVADWHHPEFPAQYSQRGFHGAPNPNADIAKYADYMRGQVRELLTNYGPIGILWFDAGGALRVPNRGELIKGDELAKMIHALQPGCLINNRAGVEADYGTPEQRIPGGKTVEPFEVCMTLNRKWGYNRFDHEWKPAPLVVRNIADIVSKGGNYLINVGPTAEGEIPAEDVAILKQVGEWTHTNAEAIYGAGPTPFGDELGAEDPAQRDKEGKPLWVSREQWRCTTRPGKLFFTLLEWPGNGGSFKLPAFPNKIKRAYFLSDPSHDLNLLLGPGRGSATAASKARILTLNPNGIDLRNGSPSPAPASPTDLGLVKLPEKPPAGLAPVLCVEIEGSVQPQQPGAKLDSKKDTGS
jgi:alpha-L-fucosidase